MFFDGHTIVFECREVGYKVNQIPVIVEYVNEMVIFRIYFLPYFFKLWVGDGIYFGLPNGTYFGLSKT